MILQQTDNYIKACMKTWLICEACIHAETTSGSPRESLVIKCRTCANSCFTVVCRILNNSEIMQESAFICLLNCRECFSECENYAYVDDIEYCGEVCRLCSETLKHLILPVFLN
jgi:hypothetical protein